MAYNYKNNTLAAYNRNFEQMLNISSRHLHIIATNGAKLLAVDTPERQKGKKQIN